MERLRIGFLVLTMSEFDAVLKVEDVRSGNIPDINTPEYLKPMICFLGKYGTVVYPGVVGDEKTAENARTIFQKERIDVVVAHEISFTLDLTCLQSLEGIQVPIILWNTQMLRTLNKDTGFGQVMSNSGVAGVPQFTNALYKQGRKFKVVTGYEGTPETERCFERIFKVVGIAKKLKTVKIGKIGYTYPGMTTLTIDEAFLKGQLGPCVENIPMRDIMEAYKNISEKDVIPELDRVKKECDVCGLSSQELVDSVKMYLAIKKVLQEKNIGALGVLCQEMILEKELGTVPCYAMSRLLEDGIVSTCECDVPTAVAMMITKELAGDAWFLEFYTMDMDRGLLMLSHCGYGNCSMAASDRKMKAKQQPCFPGARGGGIAYEFGAGGDDITIVSLTQVPAGKFKLVAARAESVNYEPYPIACPQMMIRFKNKNLQEGIDDFCQSGAMHHMAVGYGDISREVKMLAQLLDIEFELV